MNFNEAIDTLNKHNHRGSKGWHPSGHVDGIKVSPGYPFAIILSSLEAIAIAKALVEQEQTEKPKPSIERIAIESLQNDIDGIRKRLMVHDTAQAFTQKYAENLEGRLEKLEKRSVRMSGEYVTVNGLREILKDVMLVIPEPI